MKISISKLRNRDLHEIMRFVYCMDRERFVAAFQQIGIPIMSEEDLTTLVDIHSRRLDVDGTTGLKNAQGELLRFDIREFVNYNIPVRNNMIAKCKIEYVK